eukprot:1158044-Pelagomonas_calceolata.AAC.10
MADVGEQGETAFILASFWRSVMRMISKVCVLKPVLLDIALDTTGMKLVRCARSDDDDDDDDAIWENSLGMGCPIEMMFRESTNTHRGASLTVFKKDAA